MIGPFNYQAEAQQTKSDQFHGDMVSRNSFIQILTTAIVALQDLDRVKKTLFYGKENPGMLLGSKQTCVGLNEQVPTDIIHGIIGKATEAGELLEALFDTTIYNKDLDIVNIGEEIGDGLWYDAILLDAIGSTFANVQKINIDKLRHRYPAKFTEYDAQNRDLFGERKILED